MISSPFNSYMKSCPLCELYKIQFFVQGLLRNLYEELESRIRPILLVRLLVRLLYSGGVLHIIKDSCHQSASQHISISGGTSPIIIFVTHRLRYIGTNKNSSDLSDTVECHLIFWFNYKTNFNSAKTFSSCNESFLVPYRL